MAEEMKANARKRRLEQKLFITQNCLEQKRFDERKIWGGINENTNQTEVTPNEANESLATDSINPSQHIRQTLTILKID